MWRAVDRVLAWPLRLLVALYRWLLSPILPASCRFYPSCSAYADEALHKHGFVRGGALTAWRLCRCHPFHPGGFDPVPPTRGERVSDDPLADRPQPPPDVTRRAAAHQEDAACAHS